MKTIQKMALVAVILLGLQGCMIIGIGVGAVAGSGTSVGVVGGAVIGGAVGYGLSH